MTENIVSIFTHNYKNKKFWLLVVVSVMCGLDLCFSLVYSHSLTDFLVRSNLCGDLESAL